MLRTVLTLLGTISFVCIVQTPTNAADYDATGMWEIVTPWQIFEMNIVQGPDDTFCLQIDAGYTPDINYLYWCGIITGNHYEVTDCRFEDLQPLSTDIPGHEDTGFFITDGQNPPIWWFLADTTSFSFDLSSQNVMSGGWYFINSGWKSPIITAETSFWSFDPDFEGEAGGSSFGGTRIELPCWGAGCPQATQASTVHGQKTAYQSNILNLLSILLVPMGATIVLRFWRRKK